jgi:Leucine-rich repeat (LRR) protein
MAMQIVPKGVFSDIPRLKTCDLSNNSIKGLPDDVGMLKELESLVLHHNCLSALPATLYSLSGLKTLDVSYNRLTRLQHEIGFMEGLQVRSPPADTGSSRHSVLRCGCGHKHASLYQQQQHLLLAFKA